MAYRLSPLHFRLARPRGIATIGDDNPSWRSQGDDAAAKIVGDRTSSSWPINLLVEALELLGRDIRFRLSIRAAMTILRRADRGRVLDDVFRPLVEVEVN
jgi:hypothetical protein